MVKHIQVYTYIPCITKYINFHIFLGFGYRIARISCISTTGTAGWVTP